LDDSRSIRQNNRELKMSKTKIIGLSSDRKGLIVEKQRVNWHVHSGEMTTEQKKVHKRLLKELDEH